MSVTIKGFNFRVSRFPLAFIARFNQQLAASERLERFEPTLNVYIAGRLTADAGGWQWTVSAAEAALLLERVECIAASAAAEGGATVDLVEFVQ